MSEAWIALLGVALGSLLTPITQGIAYRVRRGHEKEDRKRAERREDLVLLQDTLLDLVRAEEALQVVDMSDEAQRDEMNRQIAIVKREVRFRAARVGDGELWKMVNTPPDNVFSVVIGEELGPGDPSVAPDRYDQWNARIRELFQEL